MAGRALPQSIWAQVGQYEPRSLMDVSKSMRAETKKWMERKCESGNLPVYKPIMKRSICLNHPIIPPKNNCCLPLNLTAPEDFAQIFAWLADHAEESKIPWHVDFNMGMWNITILLKNGKYFIKSEKKPISEKELMDWIFKDFFDNKIKELEISGGGQTLARWTLDPTTGNLVSQWPSSEMDEAKWIIASGESWDYIKEYLKSPRRPLILDMVIDTLYKEARVYGRDDLIDGPLSSLQDLSSRINELFRFQFSNVGSRDVEFLRARSKAMAEEVELREELLEIIHSL